MVTHDRVNSIGALVVAAVLTFATTGQYAFGDTVVNNVVAGGNDTIAAGDSTTIDYWLDVTNGTPTGDVNGCNSPGVTPATGTISAPAQVSVTGSPFQWTSGCGSANFRSVTFGSNTPGDYLITIDATGGKSGSL